MPETQRSGFRFRISCTAIFTQSTGVPEQLYSMIASVSFEILFRCSVLLMVMACPIALCGLSGATTITSPISDITSIKALIPGAETPSSFVISINGLSIFISIVFKKRIVKKIKIRNKCSNTKSYIANK